MERHRDDDTENLALRVYCASLDMDFHDYDDDLPDDVAGLMGDISILEMYGGGYILQALDMITPYPSEIDLDDAESVAAAIRRSSNWDDDLCRRLCELAGLGKEYAAADGDTFESVVFEAAQKLKVIIVDVEIDDEI